MSIQEFGPLPDGTMVHSVTIGSGDLRAEILSWGACIRDLRLTGFDHPLVLGLNSGADYAQHSPHFGVIAGRCANRINKARFKLDGQTIQLQYSGESKTGQPGPHQLHGGPKGYGKRVWIIADHGPDFVTLTLHSPAGDGGYPGTAEISCTYRISGATLTCDLQATTDAPTLMNLAQHSYFNLNGDSTINAHRLHIPAGQVVAVDAELIPTGDLTDRAGSDQDFRQPIPIAQTKIDHNYCLGRARFESPRLAARVETDAVCMEIHSTEPGVQFYTGDKIAVPVAGLEGRHYGPRAGLCLEPQIWPDAINNPSFPQAILRPGETYHQISTFTFSPA